MIYQSEEMNVSVFINNEMVPAVTQVDIDLERAVVDSAVDKNDKKYLVTLTRYMPVGVTVTDFFALSGFSVVVVDSWMCYTLLNCEWTKIKRVLTADGVVESATFLASSVSVM